MTDKAADIYAHEIGDWRLLNAGWAWLSDEHEPRAFRLVSHHAPRDNKPSVSFHAPSAAALHLNAAWKAAHRAQALKASLKLNAFERPEGGHHVSPQEDHTVQLFDYFEEMIAVAFGSFGAIEAFCNQVVVEKGAGPLQIKGRKKRVVSPEEAERFASTDEKLRRLVPDLLNVPTPCGKQEWELFRKIKASRDAVTHFKRHDQAKSADRDHEPTVLVDLLFKDCFEMPEAAMALINYFHKKDPAPRWLMNPAWRRP